MSCYVSSNNNRFYVALETAYGVVPGVIGQQRIPGVKLAARQALEETSRRDKSGSRTFVGLPNRIRKRTAFQLNTFMTDWMSVGQRLRVMDRCFRRRWVELPWRSRGGRWRLPALRRRLLFRQRMD